MLESFRRRGASALANSRPSQHTRCRREARAPPNLLQLPLPLQMFQNICLDLSFTECGGNVAAKLRCVLFGLPSNELADPLVIAASAGAS